MAFGQLPILALVQATRTIAAQAGLATPQVASIANTVITAQLQAIANVTTQIQNITNVAARVVTFATDDHSNSIIRSSGEANLVHGMRPTANTKGVNGQMWYHPDGNLYVCVNAYTANAYYRWQRVQLVNL